jgi:hypothetical protein
VPLYRHRNRPRYPLKRRLRGTQRRSGEFWRNKNLHPTRSGFCSAHLLWPHIYEQLQCSTVSTPLASTAIIFVSPPVRLRCFSLHLTSFRNFFKLLGSVVLVFMTLVLHLSYLLKNFSLPLCLSEHCKIFGRIKYSNGIWVLTLNEGHRDLHGLYVTLFGPRYLSRRSDSLQAGRFGYRIPGGSETSRTHPDRPWGPPSRLYNECWVTTGSWR